MLRFFRRLLRIDRWKPLEARTDATAALHLKYLTFKDLIASNDEILEVIAEVEKKLEGRTTFGMAFVRSSAVTAAAHAYRMIQKLDSLSQRRYPELYARFSDIQHSVERILAREPVRERGAYVLPLASVSLAQLDRVGGKSANLGELKNRAGLPVPEGFAVTTGACVDFFAANQLQDEIRALLLGLDVEDLEAAAATADAIRQAILAAVLPPAIEVAILAGYQRLSASLGSEPRVALRSSAVGEDGELSFAGQYVTVLNVPRREILAAYKEVIAGLYTPRAICYRAIKGIPDEDVPMGVSCLAMVDAVASGVACSVDPNRPDARRMVVNGAWGLGVATVDGSVSPDAWTVTKGERNSVISRSAGSKETSVEALPEGGVAAAPVPAELRPALCLSDGQVEDLARLVAAAEAHYGVPQEVEWALDRSGRFVLLQARPLHASSRWTEKEEAPADVGGHARLLTGAAASTGCASGRVFLSFGPDDIAGFPEGAVLVARQSHPQYVRVMDRAAAIVADIGAPTGHMASLAREFGIPAVLDTHAATALLKPGDVVTVDGGRGAVYEGHADGLLAQQGERRPRGMSGTPVHAALAEVARHVVTLTLTDPKSPEFAARSCRTFHDIARFVHERAFEEMFRVSDRVSYDELRSLPLAARLPFTVYLIDLGGGLQRRAGAASVQREDVASLPMAALLDGMTNPELRWWQPKALSISGVASVTTQAIFTPFVEYGERRLGDRSYAIVAEAYCNFSSRIGYHFATVDSYCGDSPSRNYISFRFKGGAADETRRINRCVLLERILLGLDFQVERQADLVNARIRKYGRAATLERLDMLGRLIIASRQLDMRMGARASVEWYANAFTQGNYLFDPDFRADAGERGGAKGEVQGC
ncbi:MAG: PEP/pyruvate-binding domain-containing protein [Thermoanaerobaculaceae bacterium]|nr:PEP/pyruvate-binding domain-containing protein [Thermoanaerobaculaceae bacterium]